MCRWQRAQRYAQQHYKVDKCCEHWKWAVSNEQWALSDERWVVPLIVRATTDSPNNRQQEWFAFIHSSYDVSNNSFHISHQKEIYYSNANVSIIYPVNCIVCLLFSFLNRSPSLLIEMAWNFIKIWKLHDKREETDEMEKMNSIISVNISIYVTNEPRNMNMLFNFLINNTNFQFKKLHWKLNTKHWTL